MSPVQAGRDVRAVGRADRRLSSEAVRCHGRAANHHDPARTVHLRGRNSAAVRERAQVTVNGGLEMKLAVNGVEVDVDDRHAKTPLLWVLRDVLGMHGTKFGCGAGFCAACTVLIDGRNMKSCQTMTERAVGKASDRRSREPPVPWSMRSATRGITATSCSAGTASPARPWPRSRCSRTTRRLTTRRSTPG